MARQEKGAGSRWWRDGNPHDLVEVLQKQGTASKRKLRLATAGCLRRAWGLMKDRARYALEQIEAHADGAAKYRQVYTAARACESAGEHWAVECALLAATRRNACEALGHTLLALLGCCWLSPDSDKEEPPFTQGGCWSKPVDWHRERRALSRSIRDVFGNPFLEPTFPAAWRTADPVRLAEGLYRERAFERLPVLADALEEAGCTDAAILEHLREPSDHVRGCWAVDLVLDRS
jgi:hypothetical protein